MTADQARRKHIELHEFPKYVKMIEKAIQEGKREITIGKNSTLVDMFKDKGYRVVPDYNDNYEMRIEGYTISW